MGLTNNMLQYEMFMFVLSILLVHGISKIEKFSYEAAVGKSFFPIHASERNQNNYKN